ncbi:MAG: transposase [Nanoarchaeota archaeon]|nr:transposase [Nanoarchaeota archaeon]
MTELVRSSHKVFKIKYHVVFCIKYRKDLFLEEKYVSTVKQVCKDIEDRFYMKFEITHSDILYTCSKEMLEQDRQKRI